MKFHPLADIFPMLEGKEFDDLVEDISRQGLLEDIKLLGDEILDGRNRFLACQTAGVAPRFERYQGDNPAAYVIGLNLKRRHLDESQRALASAKLANMRQGERTDVEPSANLPKVSVADAAKLLNVSERSVTAAKAVLRDGTPELQREVERGHVAVSAAADIATQPQERQREIVAKGKEEILKAAKDIRTEKAETRRKELLETAMKKAAVPDGKYGVIVLDPPWPMQKIERDVRPNQVAFEYPTMNEAELRDFGATVLGMAAEDCHLFMWTTQKFLPLSLELLAPYGFRYVLAMVWHKPGGFQPIGLPQYNCEFVLYARRGSPQFTDTKAFNCCFEAPRREHSRKPDIFYDTIRRTTLGPRIDVFSREQREGFDQFGNETEKFQAAG